MKNFDSRNMAVRAVVGGLIMFAVSAGQARAQSNISPVNKWSWSENSGWTNWFDFGLPGMGGAVVSPSFISGFIWSENTGWLFLGDGTPTGVAASGPFYTNAVAADTGVNIAPDGTLSGFAWGENIGWVNFATVGVAGPLGARIDQCCPSGQLSGFAWGENIGWINLASAFGFVGLSPAAVRAKADVTGDGLRDGLDIADFMAVLFSPATASPPDFCAADMNDDGTVTNADIAPFVNCLLTGVCPCP